MTEQEKQALADLHAHQQNITLMQQIVSEMKIIPELPSEKPQDVNRLTKVEFPVAGGVLTHMEGFEHPYKGFPFFEFVDKIDALKKVQRATLSSLFHSLKVRPWYQKATLLFVPWLLKDAVRAYLYTFHRTIDRFKVKPERYCDAVRELHRAFSVEWHDETAQQREERLMVRDVVCMFLEFDNAYRFRFQDIITELNKENLEKNVGKELVRLLTIMQTRETQQEIKDTWTLAKTFLPFYLKLDKKLARSVRGVLTGLDLEKVELKVEDKLYCEKRKDYVFGFQLCQQQTSSLTKDTPRSTSQSSSLGQTPLLSGHPKLDTAS